MTDFPLELTKSKQNSSILEREGELFSNAPHEIWEGMKNRGQQMLDNKTLTGLEIVGSVAVGAAIAIGSKNPGAIGEIARVAPKVLGLVAGADMLGRVALPMYEAGRQGGNVELAQKQLGANLGSALIDYPLMAAGGFAGSKLAPGAASLLAPEKFAFGSRAPELAMEIPGPAGARSDIFRHELFKPDGYKWVPPRSLGERAPNFEIPPGSARINPELLNAMRITDFSKMLVTTREIPPPAVTAAMGVAAAHNVFVSPFLEAKEQERALNKTYKLNTESLKKFETGLHEIHGESIRRLDNFDDILKTVRKDRNWDPTLFQEHIKELDTKK